MEAPAHVARSYSRCSLVLQNLTSGDPTAVGSILSELGFVVRASIRLPGRAAGLSPI